MNAFIQLLFNRAGDAFTVYGVTCFARLLAGNNRAVVPEVLPPANANAPGLAQSLGAVALGNLVSHPIDTVGSIGRTVGALAGTVARGHPVGWNAVFRTATGRMDTLQRQISDIAREQLTVADIENAFEGQREQLEAALQATYESVQQRQNLLLGGFVVIAALTGFKAYKASQFTPIQCLPITEDPQAAFTQLLESHEAKKSLLRTAYWTAFGLKSAAVVCLLIVIGGILYLVFVKNKNDNNDTRQNSTI